MSPSFGGQPSMAQTIHYWAQPTAPNAMPGHLASRHDPPAAASYPLPMAANQLDDLAADRVQLAPPYFTLSGGHETRSAFEWTFWSPYAAISL